MKVNVRFYNILPFICTPCSCLLTSWLVSGLNPIKKTEKTIHHIAHFRWDCSKGWQMKCSGRLLTLWEVQRLSSYLRSIQIHFSGWVSRPTAPPRLPWCAAGYTHQLCMSAFIFCVFVRPRCYSSFPSDLLSVGTQTQYRCICYLADLHWV